MRKKPIIAIDGPAGSGKSTAARNLAVALDFDYLDTGAMYRAATWKAVDEGLNLDDEKALVDLLSRVDIKLSRSDHTLRVFVDDTEITDKIRSEGISRQVYHIANSGECRKLIVAQQRELGEQGGVVAEGRDIGTVVFPNADIKFFLTANAKERARRRVAQLRKAGEQADLDDVLRDIRQRDKHDTEREVSPLRQADDALVIDTSDRSPQQTLGELLRIVDERFPDLRH